MSPTSSDPDRIAPGHGGPSHSDPGQSEPGRSDKAAAELQRIREARGRGPVATLSTYVRLSGPGWLQSAITLGGGSLAASLYLGVLSGSSMLWLQPLAMAAGIVMLSAIAYVVLSTGQSPFLAINRHVNPVLGWSWALASLLASMVWALPQYSLATSVVQQNLLPGVLGADGLSGETGGKLVIVAAILAVTVFVTWSYDRGARGIRIYERTLKLMVALIVLCFFGVVVRLGVAEGELDWGAIAAGFVPDLGAFDRPAATFADALAAVGEGNRGFWSEKIVTLQREVMISAAATAVGINMTFLLPYTLLARGWNRDFRGLARFDLATGMLVPFLLATSCVVIASASRFHAQPVPGLVVEETDASAGASSGADVAPKIRGEHDGLLLGALEHSIGADAFDALDEPQREARAAGLPRAERRIAAMLVHRDAFDLAKSLRPLTGDVFANVLFGLGVLGMALSTITILMLISGFVICELLGMPSNSRAHRIGTLAATTGALGPFVWGKVGFQLAIPTSVFGMMLLPIAYWTFFCMMNSRTLLGDDLPRGAARWSWNVLMLGAAGLATAASLWSIRAKTGTAGIVALAGLLALALIVHVARRRA